MGKFKKTFSLETYLSLLTVIIFCNFFQTSYPKSTKPYGLRLRLIHINSSKSPFYGSKLTYSKIHYRKKNTKQKLNSGYNTEAINPISISTQHRTYYVELGLGEFGSDQGYQSVYLVFDLGSPYTWTQCQDCKKCFPQSSPYYRRDTSDSYIPDPCSQCRGQCEEDHCTFRTSYEDGTTLSGIWATKKLTFASDLVHPQSIDRFQFVCGIEIENFIAGDTQDNKITGVLGMGRGETSLVSQLSARGFGPKQFSYCLQDPYGGPLNSPSLIRFGDDVNFDRVNGMANTPLLAVEGHPYYYVNLYDISINNRRLNIARHVFVLQDDNTGGTIIDSGSTLSYLTPDAFARVLRGLEIYMAEHNRYLTRYRDSIRDTGYDACWEPTMDNPTVDIPSMTFHFEGNANLYVQSNQVMVTVPLDGVPAPGLYCMTMLEEPDDEETSIIGSVYQINQLMIFNLESESLSFITYQCSSRV